MTSCGRSGTSGSGPVGLHVMRAYMAPLGVAVAERLSARWATLDLDEDDAAFARSRGDVEGAASYERLLAVFAPLFDGLAAASAGEAGAIGARHGLTVEHLPNAVAPALAPTAPHTPRASAEPHPSLLFVGNLTYAPNVEAARVLVNEILPALTRRSGRRARVTLVGPHHGELAELGGPGVEVAGFVPDLAPLYASADVVVVPLRAGAGTRIKLLEAFAHQVPVVASAAAAAGLDVTPGRHLLLADGPEHAAAAIEAIIADPALAERLAGEALGLVRDRYSPDVVIPAISGFYAGAAERALRRRQAAP
jgi:glycosyltransferase involved in cell wall biosynthesis